MKDHNPTLRQIVIVLLLLTTFLSCIFSSMLYTLRKNDRISIAKNSGTTYVGVQHETNPIGLPNAPTTLKQFEEIITAFQCMPFTYYEIYQQPLDCSLSNNKFFDRISQKFVFNCNYTPCAQVGMNVLHDFNICIVSGRSFDADDFDYTHNKSIPVIMGYNYNVIYNAGEHFTADYLFSNFDFTIIGFADKGSCVNTSTVYLNLDDMIIMPSFIFCELPASDEEYVTQKIHLANKTSGKFKVPAEQFDEACKQLHEIVDNSSVGEYSISCSTYTNALKLMGVDLTILLVACFAFSILTGSFAVVLVQAWRKAFGKTFKQSAKILTIYVCLSAIGSYIIAQQILHIFGLRYRINAYYFLYAAILCALFIAFPIVKAVLRNRPPEDKQISNIH